MPINIKQNKVKFNDPTTNEYINFNTITETLNSTQIENINNQITILQNHDWDERVTNFFQNQGNNLSSAITELQNINYLVEKSYQIKQNNYSAYKQNTKTNKITRASNTTSRFQCQIIDGSFGDLYYINIIQPTSTVYRPYFIVDNNENVIYSCDTIPNAENNGNTPQLNRFSRIIYMPCDGKLYINHWNYNDHITGMCYKLKGNLELEKIKRNTFDAINKYNNNKKYFDLSYNNCSIGTFNVTSQSQVPVVCRQMLSAPMPDGPGIYTITPKQGYEVRLYCYSSYTPERLLQDFTDMPFTFYAGSVDLFKFAIRFKDLRKIAPINYYENKNESHPADVFYPETDALQYTMTPMQQREELPSYYFKKESVVPVASIKLQYDKNDNIKRDTNGNPIYKKEINLVYSNITGNYIQEKINKIYDNIAWGGPNSFTFIFITDIHWPSNNQRSPLLINYLLKHAPIKHVICGGDLLIAHTKQTAINYLKDCISSFKKYNICFPVCIGNHDRNWNNGTNHRLGKPDAGLNNNDVWALLEAQFNEHPINPWDYNINHGLNFYVDYPENNTRVIFVDNGELEPEYNSEKMDAWHPQIYKQDSFFQTIENNKQKWTDPNTEITDFSQTMIRTKGKGNNITQFYEQGYFWFNYQNFCDILSKSADKNIIIISHCIARGIPTYTSDPDINHNTKNDDQYQYHWRTTGYRPIGQQLGVICEYFNRRSTLPSSNASTATIQNFTYNFSNLPNDKGGKVHLIIGGHDHYDQVLSYTINNSNDQIQIPIMKAVADIKDIKFTATGTYPDKEGTETLSLTVSIPSGHTNQQGFHVLTVKYDTGQIKDVGIGHITDSLDYPPLTPSSQDTGDQT